MKKIVLMLVTLICLTGIAIGMEGDPNFTKVYEGKMGNVTFNHQTHSVSGDCAVCHDAFVTLDKNSAHKLCKDCHKTSEVETAPTKCKQCHIK